MRSRINAAYVLELVPGVVPLMNPDQEHVVFTMRSDEVSGQSPSSRNE